MPTVYGVALNDSATLARLGRRLHEPPYQAPPAAPVLYLKPANTWAPDGADVAVPAEPGVVRVGATLGIVIGRAATRVDRADALSHIGGYVVASDLELPHDSHFRPAVRQRCRDGFCPMSTVFPASSLSDPDQAVIRTRIDGQEVHHRTLATLVRSVPALIADITGFMTLSAGDVLLVGPPDEAPLARAGQSILVAIDGLGTLRHHLVAEAA
ncbi:fumarylacetoacetate hydrolase family protein [Piscinibacter sp. XHJ-5]|uniref:fumarylacetoacetate hydrolase family protein n=1 Tax=Piscinibacter sp. XHJ-5 TaxID=3037797 RepID=UPI0024535F6E|nr:fumarylacetoacetate hydrolase family protein [Piscinibacter sp. XHJ-5]